MHNIAIVSIISQLSCVTAVIAMGRMDGGAAAVAADLGIVRKGTSDIDNIGIGDMVSIDFDEPRYGPICISVDENDGLEFVWEEYHNLHRLLDEESFRNCDFSNAVALVPEGRPQPSGYMIEASMSTTARYFSCSKICASNGHKVKICAGGSFGEENECFITAECKPDRTIDLRTMETVASQVELSRNGYVPVGKVCRPKNGDGYLITSGIDTPESCRQKCDEDSERCGAWEFEDYAADNKECELHEFDVISYEETLAMGKCLTNSTDSIEDAYRCCWVAEEIVEAQTGTNSTNGDNEITSSGSLAVETGVKCAILSVMTTVVSLLMSHA